MVVVLVIFYRMSDMENNNSSVNVVTDLQNSDCQIHFIDVGQGDCSLIISDDSAILIDGGENNKGDIVLDYLDEIGVTKLDMVIATHPHSDHIGGLDTIINGIEVVSLIMPLLPDSIVPTTVTYTDMLSAIADNKVSATYAFAGDTYNFGKGEFTVISPASDYDLNDLNNASIGVKFTYDGVSAIFTGDMEAEAEENALRNYGGFLKSDLLKVGHHGSKTSTSKAFYNAVNPDYCAISLESGNQYGFPHKATLETLSSNGAEIYRTDLLGSFAFCVIDGELYPVVEE